MEVAARVHQALIPQQSTPPVRPAAEISGILEAFKNQLYDQLGLYRMVGRVIAGLEELLQGEAAAPARAEAAQVGDVDGLELVDTPAAQRDCLPFLGLRSLPMATNGLLQQLLEVTSAMCTTLQVWPAGGRPVVRAILQVLCRLDSLFAPSMKEYMVWCYHIYNRAIRWSQTQPPGSSSSLHTASTSDGIPPWLLTLLTNQEIIGSAGAAATWRPVVFADTPAVAVPVLGNCQWTPL